MLWPFSADAATTSTLVESSSSTLASPRKQELLEKATRSIVRLTGPGPPSKSATYGTAVRITPEGLFCTATHVVTSGGKFLGCYIGGQLTTLAASWPFFDLAFIKGELSKQVAAFRICMNMQLYQCKHA